MDVTVEGLDLGTTFFRYRDEEDDPVTLGEAIAEYLGRQVIAREGRAVTALATRAAKVREDEIRDQVRAEVAAALHGPLADTPVTLADAIRAEAQAQIRHGRHGPDYQGTATPLDQVVAAAVYTELRPEVLALVDEARKRIKHLVGAEITRYVETEFGKPS